MAADQLDGILSEAFKNDIKTLRELPEGVIRPLLQEFQAFNEVAKRFSGTAAGTAKNWDDTEKAAARLVTKQRELTFQTSDAGKQFALLNQRVKEARQNNNDYAQSVNETTSAYKKLELEHKKLKGEAQQLGVIYGTTSEQFKAAATAANEVGKKLKDIDAQLGDHRRNVGNYKSAWDGLGMSVQQIARELPNFAMSFQTGLSAISNNIAPLADEIKRAREENKALIESGKEGIPVWKRLASSIISWQTALTVGITLLVAHGDDLWNMVKGTDSAAKKIKEASEAATKSFYEETTALRIMSAEVNNSKTTHERLLQIKDDLISQYPETKKIIEGETTLQGGLEKAIGQVTNAYRIMSRVRSYEMAIGQIEMQIALKEYQSFGNYVKGLFKYGAAGAASGLGQADALIGLVDARKKLEAERDKAISELETSGGASILNGGKGKKDREKQYKEFYNEYINALRERNKARLEADKQEYEIDKATSLAILENDKETLFDRLKALEDYYSAVEGIQSREYDTELSSLQSEKETLLKEEKDYNSKKLKLTDLQHKALLLKIETVNENIKTADKRREAEMTTNALEENKKRLEIMTKYGAQEVEAALAKLNNIKAGFNYTGNNLQDTNNLIKEQIAWLTQWAVQLALTGVDVTKLKEKIEDLNAALNKNHDADIAKTEALKKQIQALAIQAQQEWQNTINQIGHDIYQRRIDNLQKEGDLISQNLEWELRRIELTGRAQNLSDAEIAKNKLNAQKIAELERQKVEARIKQEKIKQWKFDRAANVNQIIANTALAVIAAIAQYKGTPVGYVIAAANAAIGAAQLARALTAPMPAYAEGTMYHKGGKALIGEGGEKELVQEPGGKTYIVDKPTIANLPVGTRVIPEHDLTRHLGLLSPSLLQSIKQNPSLTDKIKLSDESIDKLARSMAGRMPKQPNINFYGADVYRENHILRRS